MCNALKNLKLAQEYPVANPLQVLALQPLIQHCVRQDPVSAEAFDLSDLKDRSYSQSNDPFNSLPAELLSILLSFLGPRDICNLRLSTRSCRQLPQQLFAHLIKRGMPWAWEGHNPERQYELV